MSFRRSVLALPLILAACATPPPGPDAPDLTALDTRSLWAMHGTTSGLDHLAVEAELGARGQTISGASYLGQRTAGGVGRSSYARGTVSGTAQDRFNCGDFLSAGAAQVAFLRAGGPMRDPHRLDADGDGFACEWGTRVRTVARTATRPARIIARPHSTPSSRCHVGPRGGTYTITSGGNKNYDGC
ncbi:excalibur calcium-binding domain-containing protein [Jannaschia sp. S6380]|uniref:excalibur calcium-binding domain-containing protein n=1 Tax=Jannaschia sp. S6380 TaxID=2926408 RepID=UPI001FF45880|nr:excalibur calcium-binding domain-containing protein [Jannaschia sp. S6380]MCK0166852.1 excalibur calcium-binding domain-containing protein [Jannaschia sp. S6380]